MYLKRIEIQGFKSFPEKIHLEFKNGITGVVGPNGSGKSNISDAIRWVLGEQSARALRGDKMEDIIFSGTQNRKKLGFCEVSIILDNSEKRLNIDYTEIKVSRKVYRSGESGYFINGNSCRLRDINELFMDTGIGKEGYSIIGQGKIDSILSNKSEDRRAVFEEAVGIGKYRIRKAQTEYKLEEVRKNLVRTTDIIEEIEKQLAPLQEQEEKAKKFLSFSEELKDIHMDLFVEKYNRFKGDILDVNTGINTLEEDISTLENKKNEQIQNQNNLKEKLFKKDDEINKIKEISSDISINIEKKQGEISLKKQNIDFINEDSSRIEREKNKIKEDIEKRQQNIKYINSALLAKKIEYSTKVKCLNTFLDNLKNYSTNIVEDEKKINDVNNIIMTKLNKSSEISNSITSSKGVKEEYKKRNGEIIVSINLNKSKLKEKETRGLVLKKDITELIKQEDTYNKAIQCENEDMEILQKDMSETKNMYVSYNKKYIELENRYKILNDLEKGYEGYYNSVKSVLKEKEKNTQLSGICGVVGELISVPQKYETAIEIALGGAIQNIITKTDNDAKIAIQYLKNTKKGRATFLPITSIKPKNIEYDKENILKEEGILNIANNIIQYDDIYKDILSSLLGRVIIVDNINNAMKIAKKYKFKYKIVTLDGDIINTGGALTGGSIYKKATNIFSRTREIVDIKDEMTYILEQIKDKEKNIKIKEEKMEIHKEKLEKYKQNTNDIYIKKATLEGELSQTKEYIENIANTINDLNKQKNSLEESLSIYSIDEKNLEKTLNNLNKEIEELKQNLSGYKINLEKINNNKDEITTNINNTKLEIQTIEHKIGSYENDIYRIEKEIEEINKEAPDKDIELNKSKKNSLENEIKLIEKNIQNMKEEYKNAQQKYDELHKEKIYIDENIERATQQILSITTNIADTTNKQIKLQGKKENIENKLEELTESMWEDYKITYAGAVNKRKDNNINYDELIKKENDIKKNIHSLGNVNVSAIDEYKIIKQRYEFNVEQKRDIIQADDDLKKIIDNLERDMKIQFKEQFSLINKNFKEVFSQMFNGGSANLRLCDEDNILNSGIEIAAQPPGKSLQSLTLLSGGERTLTAMSLLFAILRMKPSPFCVLDEIEAALDDANVHRYAKFLKKFAQRTQFILITHKTGAMEIADALYGVTMQEQGVSKVISVQLKDAKQY